MSKHSYDCKLCHLTPYLLCLFRVQPPNKSNMLDIWNIILYLKLTINIGQFHQEIQDMTMM